MNPVLHRAAQPVAVHEFYDALRAAAPPRFPLARCVWFRRAGLAISGGVDSMALAWLCAQLRTTHPFARVADAQPGGFTAIIVDHGLRPGSAAEASAVSKAVQKLGHRTQVCPLRWGDGGPPPSSSLETAARRLRYRMLGARLAELRVVSLLLAHHEDDQYETVLMRLLSGRGEAGAVRGLRGMRAAVDLPECQGIYGAHQSGFLDDQRAPAPYLLLRPSRRERRRIRSAFREDLDLAVLAGEMEGGATASDLDWQHLTHLHDLLGRSAPPLAPLDTEDLGIVAYRPLLPFAKDRLVATCEAHNVPWFEDPTNADRTLTLRNAVRHLVRNYALPAALQKPAVLRLAARCDATARQHEAEARRLITRHRMIVRFTANVGTVVTRLPRLRPHARRRHPFLSSPAYKSASLEKRRRHLRTVAALVVRNLLALVTPETNVTPVSQLHGVVDALFPDLADPKTAAPVSDPKSFIICGVHFMPLLNKSSSSSPSSSAVSTPPTPAPAPAASWYLARAPYVSADRTLPPAPTVPFVMFPGLSLAHRRNKQPPRWNWSGWSPWQLYDGRFWVRLRSRLPVRVHMQPFDREHSKGFREALAAAPGGQGPSRTAAFLATLKTHAPAKVRYTLPAVYASNDVDWALQGKPYWPEDCIQEGVDPPRTDPFTWEREQRRLEEESWPDPEHPRWRLLALPTLGAHVPGIEHWLQWEVRYRKVDAALLESSEEAPLGWA